MRFQRLDLNLLVALDALLEERNVSQAADRICLSQSAGSSALARLREYFNDELLISKGRQMVLTPRAEALIEPVRSVLSQIRSTIAVAPPFIAAETDRTLKIMASDYATEILLAPAFSAISREAPGLRFEIQSPQEEIVEALERGTIDILLSLEHALSQDHPKAVLFEDDYVVVGWSGNDRLKDGITQDGFFELGHVVVELGRQRVRTFEEAVLRRYSLTRRVELIAPSFLSVPHLLVGSDRIALLQRRLAEQAAKYLPLRILPSPIVIPSIRQAVQWHKSSDTDEAIRWVVERLVAAAQTGAERTSVASATVAAPHAAVARASNALAKAGFGRTTAAESMAL